MRDFVIFFAIQFLQYFLITVNFRAVSQGLYVYTFISDLAVATNGFLLIKRVSEAKGRGALAGYALGGAIGSMVAIFITKKAYGA